MKALVGTFNQEKALGEAFSMIVKTDCETDGSFYSTTGGAQARGKVAFHAGGLFLSGPNLGATSADSH